jgi:hypothetical protein
VSGYVDVTLISCVYGKTHDQFIEDWTLGVEALDPFPENVVVACDRSRRVLCGRLFASCDWKHPQAFYLQQALELVETEWVWIHDIDDKARPDALEGIQFVDADVWQFGYERSDGEVYIPPQLEASEVLFADSNPFVAGSCIRTAKLREVGGFPDVALQDWALWRRLALASATFQSSGRVHFDYRRHPHARGERELVLANRDNDVREMLYAEGLVAYTV